MSASVTPTLPNQLAGVAQAGQGDSRTAGETRRFYPKTHANYWKSRLEHRTYSRDGKTSEVAEWSVRIHYKGIRRSFDLETASKEEAATKARDTQANMTPDEFALIEGDITATTNAVGLVNVNTASGPVLACLFGYLGMSTDYAAELVAYREANPTRLNTMAWIVDVLGQENALPLGPYVTGHSYQWTADIVAVGHHGRGYQRAKFVFDMSEGTPRIVYQQDLTHLGWALGTDVRRNLQLGNQTR
jgi:hypothetical protein